MKSILTFLIIILSVNTFSQDFFDWGTGAGKMGLSYENIISDSESGVIALASQSELSSWYYNPSFIQADGERSRQSSLHQNEEASLVLRFDSTGQLKWSRQIPNNQAEILQLAVGADNKSYLVIHILTWDYNEEDQPYGYCATFARNTFKPGLYIFTLSPDGDLESTLSIKDISNPERVHITDFFLYNNSQFVLGGFLEDAGKLVNHLPHSTFNGGGDFVMNVDKNGHVLWADMVCYRLNEHSGLSLSRQMDIAPDGTIYLAGTYVEGAIFSNGKQTLVPKKYGDQSYRNLEVYVVAYTKKGEIKWIRTNESISEFQRFKATNKGVFIAHKVHEPKSFGKKIKTASKSTVLLTHLNKRGKKKWDILSKMDNFKAIELNANGHLIVTGNYRIKHKNREKVHYFGDFEMTNRHNTFITQIDFKSNILSYKSDYFGRSKEPAHLTTNKNGDSFIAFEVFCTLSRNLNTIAKNLPDLDCRGSVAILGKLISFEK